MTREGVIRAIVQRDLQNQGLTAEVVLGEAASREELSELLSHALAKAGNATLLTNELRDTLVDHAAGNYRLLMTMGSELLAYGLAQEVTQLDEKCYLEVFQPSPPRAASKEKVRA